MLWSVFVQDWFVNEADIQENPFPFPQPPPPPPFHEANPQNNENSDWDWNSFGQPENFQSQEQKSSPDDIMAQFFNHPGDRPVQQIVDWNDRDFLKVSSTNLVDFIINNSKILCRKRQRLRQ